MIKVIFGILSDRYGRKWPLVANLVIVSALEVGAGFVTHFNAFLALRSLFGIGMGGIWGMAASTALENLPVEFRGIASGVLQQGYAVGYLIASVINLFLVPSTHLGWRSLFYAASGISFAAAILRALLPESEVFLRARAVEEANGTSSTGKTKIFLRETKEMLKAHWLRCIYAVLLMTGKIPFLSPSRSCLLHFPPCNALLTTILLSTGFNFLSHGSQECPLRYLNKSSFIDPDHRISTPRISK
jgi:SHS family lactate transporter-like MFS transporter